MTDSGFLQLRLRIGLKHYSAASSEGRNCYISAVMVGLFSAPFFLLGGSRD